MDRKTTYHARSGGEPERRRFRPPQDHEDSWSCACRKLVLCVPEAVASPPEAPSTNPRARTFRHVSPRAALKQIEKIEAKTMKLLGNHRMWYLALYYDSRAESQLDWIERQIDENLAHARALVFDVCCRRMARFVAVVKIQRTTLKRLYVPTTGQIPKISRALMDEGFVGTGEFLGVGSGDSDGE